MNQQTIGQATWSGNHWGHNGAIARARREYRRLLKLSCVKPYALEDGRLVYMNALYSAFGSMYPSARRGNPLALIRAVSTFRCLRPLLESYASDAETRSKGSLSADQMEMLGAMLVKYADVPRLGGQEFRDSAVSYATAAQRASRPEFSPHTPALAALTLARADIAVEGKEGRSREHLRFAEQQASKVEDGNQRARIFRSLAEIWNDLGEHEKAWEFLERAMGVPGIDADVLAKIVEVSRTIRS